MLSIKADKTADDIHAVAMSASFHTELTPALVTILNAYPLPDRTAIRALAAAITSGVAAT
jgi:hypothetical protein